MRRPSEVELASFLATCADASLTYAPVGGSLNGLTPAGMKRHRWTTGLPEGAFAPAAEAIRTWALHRGAGLVVATDGPLAVGTNVVLSAPFLRGFVDAACRVVAVIDEDDRYGFAYGTLKVHPERGEESFLVVRRDNNVRFDVQAVSTPNQHLARLVPPIARWLQHTAVNRYLHAMRQFTA